MCQSAINQDVPQMTFGRDPDNSRIFERPEVSRHHGVATLLKDGYCLVEDRDSKNGISVNTYRIKTARVGPNDKVCLAGSIELDLSPLFKLSSGKAPAQAAAPKGSNNDFSELFNALKSVWEYNQETRIRISKRHQFKSTLIRSILGLAPLLVWVIFKAVYLDQFKNSTDPPSIEVYRNWQGSFIYFSVIGSSIGNMLAGFFVESPQKKLNELDEEFRVRYVCPNPICKQQLGGIPWQSYKNQGKCFRCGAKYSENSN